MVWHSAGRVLGGVEDVVQKKASIAFDYVSHLIHSKATASGNDSFTPFSVLRTINAVGKLVRQQ